METSAHLPPPAETTPTMEEQPRRKWLITFGLVAGGLLLIALIALAIIYLVQPSTPTSKIRDIFIIFMALESLLVGFSLVILIVQVARLINLLQNELAPILERTQETVNTLRGTTLFLSENVVQPVIRLNEYLASIQRLLKLLNIIRK
jgi:nitrate reductase gamma subunit